MIRSHYGAIFCQLVNACRSASVRRDINRLAKPLTKLRFFSILNMRYMFKELVEFFTFIQIKG